MKYLQLLTLVLDHAAKMTAPKYFMFAGRGEVEGKELSASQTEHDPEHVTFATQRFGASKSSGTKRGLEKRANGLAKGRL